MTAPVDLLHKMLAIPSPSGGEDDLARFLEKTMDGLGFAARRDDAGNVIGDIGTGDGPTVMFLSHLDTVDRPLPARMRGGRRRARWWSSGVCRPSG
jgi:[amino group carrier protein]-lysine/ornithine hydrolase